MEDGVWRTVSGRRIFIKDGQSLSDAMKNSGKFKDNNDKIQEKLFTENDIENDEVKKLYGIYKSKFEIMKENGEKAEEYLKRHYEIKEKFINELEKLKKKREEIGKYNEKDYSHLSSNERYEMRKNDKKLSEKYETHQGIKRYRQGIEDMNKKEMSLEFYRYQIALQEKNMYKDYLIKIKEFDSIVVKENLSVSISPYSSSAYAHKKGEEIDWGTKPEGSYRLADHWNWDNGTHCPTDTNEDFGFAIGKQVNGKYTKIL